MQLDIDLRTRTLTLVKKVDVQVQPIVTAARALSAERPLEAITFGQSFADLWQAVVIDAAVINAYRHGIAWSHIARAAGVTERVARRKWLAMARDSEGQPPP